MVVKCALESVIGWEGDITWRRVYISIYYSLWSCGESSLLSAGRERWQIAAQLMIVLMQLIKAVY